MRIVSCIIPEIWKVTGRIFCHFGTSFARFSNLENQNFEKIKKMPVDVIILQMCTINDNHMMYGS